MITDSFTFQSERPSTTLFQQLLLLCKMLDDVVTCQRRNGSILFKKLSTRFRSILTFNIAQYTVQYFNITIQHGTLWLKTQGTKCINSTFLLILISFNCYFVKFKITYCFRPWGFKKSIQTVKYTMKPTDGSHRMWAC